MKLRRYTELTADMLLRSGLHIGTGEKVERGEPLAVMESVRTRLPYVPGSSLKGKMRCLLEMSYGRRETDPKDGGSPCWCGVCQICLLFGSGNASKTYEPTRLIFRDSYLTDSAAALLERIRLEEKPGVRIDRVSGKAAEHALFPTDRVPEGCEFKIEISARVFEDDDEEAVKKWLTMGLFLIEHDALGGGGTRGSGYVKFNNIEFDGKRFDENWRVTCQSNQEKLLAVPIKRKPNEDLSN